MQRVVVRYGLAVSLAILASVPFVVGLFAGVHAASIAALWLSLLSFEWLLFQPSVLRNEDIPEARTRMVRNLLRDPVFWFMAFVVIFSLVRWLNTGMELAYDLEQEVWSVTEPPLVALPSSKEGVGFPFFAASLSLLVLVSGVREGLGRAARAMCLLVGSLVTGVAGMLAAAGVCCGNPATLQAAGRGLMSPMWVGDVFAIWLVAAAAALGQVEERGWKKVGLPVVFIAIAGCAAGTVFMCPPYVAAAAIVAAVVAAVLSFNYAGCNAGLVATARAVVVFALAVSLSFVALTSLVPEELWKDKIAHFTPATALTEKNRSQREALMANAWEMWKTSPWLGKGVGCYAMNAPFNAQKEDWEKLPNTIEFVPNGFAEILAERGIVGCMVVVTGFCLLLFSGLARFAAGFKKAASNSDAPSPFMAVPSICWAQLPLVVFLIAEMCYASSPVRQAHVWVAFVFILAMASASFPRVKREKTASAANMENRDG